MKLSAAHFDAIADDIERAIFRPIEYSDRADVIVRVNWNAARREIRRALAVHFVREEEKLPLVVTEAGFELLLKAVTEAVQVSRDTGDSAADTASSALRRYFDVDVRENS